MRRPFRPVLAATGLCALVALGGCTSPSEGRADAPPEPGDAVVELVGLDFAPRSVQVPVGRRVVWRWTDSVVHNVVSEDFVSSKALDGGTYVVRFDRPGSFAYRCTLHTGMDGTVTVTA